jgi:rhomboid family GlyGly-CTERM serine protease
MLQRIRRRLAARLGEPPVRLSATTGTLLLSLPVLAGIASPLGLEYDRAAIAAGELWRVVTCHWVHWSLDHLLWDLLAFAALVFLAWRASPRRALGTLLLAALTIPLVVALVLPEMQRYRGLSGLDSALFTLTAITLLRRERASGRRLTAWIVGSTLAGFGAKIAFELWTGATFFADSAGFVPVPLAHVVGGVCGWVGALCYAAEYPGTVASGFLPLTKTPLPRATSRPSPS